MTLYSRAQECREEVAAIAAMIERLLAGSWTDASGIRPMTAEDIIIVAPYNAQPASLRLSLVAEHHVEHPVEAIFDAPMSVNVAGGGFGGEGRRRDIVAGIGGSAIPEFCSRSNLVDGAFLDAAVPLVEIGDRVEDFGRAVAKQSSISARRVG